MRATADLPGSCPWTRSEAPHYNLGWAIYIQADDGIYTVKYGHTIVGSEAPFGIAVGTHVTPGQPIAQEGSTGCSSGPHLHLMFVDRTTGRFVDPMNFLGPNRASERGAVGQEDARCNGCWDGWDGWSD